MSATAPDAGRCVVQRCWLASLRLHHFAPCLHGHCILHSTQCTCSPLVLTAALPALCCRWPNGTVYDVYIALNVEEGEQPAISIAEEGIEESELARGVPFTLAPRK